MTFSVNGRAIGADHPPYVIAELSANHNGSLDRALETIDTAQRCGADAIKLQTYTADTMTINCDEPDFMVRGGLWDGYKLYDLYKWAQTPFEWHQRPEIVQRRKQGSARGGRNRQRFARRIGEDTRLETVEDIADLSVRALGELEAGRLDIRSGTAVLFGCKTALDASAMAGRDTQGASEQRVSAWTLDLELAALSELITGQRRSSRPRSALERLRDFASRVSGRV